MYKRWKGVKDTTDQEDKNKEQKGVNPIGIAVTGAVVGAGIAVAGAVALHNEDNRKKVKQAFGDIKDRAVDYMHDMQKKAEDKKDAVTKKLTTAEKKAGSVTKKAGATAAASAKLVPSREKK